MTHNCLHFSLRRLARIVHLSVCYWLSAAMISGIALLVANAAPVEAHDTDLRGKVFVGYQGWHLARNDGSPYGGWFHWFQNKSSASCANIGVEMYPDMSQYDSDEKYPTEMKMRDGSQACLYSSFNPKTVWRHFQWMKDYGIDGAFVQRFTHELHKPEQFAQKNTVLASSRMAAETAGVLFAVRYDMSGHHDATIEADLQNDWA
jgi:hypothetical protein